MSLKSPKPKEKGASAEPDKDASIEPQSEELPGAAPAEDEESASEALTGEKNWPEEAEKYQDLYLRASADLENVKKRLEREKDSSVRFANLQHYDST